MKDHVMLFEEHSKMIFVSSRDKDFPGGQVQGDHLNMYITASTDAIYTEEFLTNGGASHAIRHLKEFDESYYYSLLSKLHDIIVSKIENPKTEYKLRLMSKDKEVAVGDKIIHYLDSQSGAGIVLNTLDYVNDKMEADGIGGIGNEIGNMKNRIAQAGSEYNISQWERQNVIPIIKEMYAKYYNILDDKYISKAIDLTGDTAKWPGDYSTLVNFKNDSLYNMYNNGETVSFLVFSKGNRARYYISFEDKEKPVFIKTSADDTKIITGYKMPIEQLKRVLRNNQIRLIGDSPVEATELKQIETARTFLETYKLIDRKKRTRI